MVYRNSGKTNFRFSNAPLKGLNGDEKSPVMLNKSKGIKEDDPSEMKLKNLFSKCGVVRSGQKGMVKCAKQGMLMVIILMNVKKFVDV